MATHDKNAASTKEIDSWVDRIEEITGALDAFLKSDPAAEEKRKADRAAARKKASDDAAMERVRERYDSKRYKKYEDDAWIAEMLAACDKPQASAHARHTDLTAFEKVTLREAEEEKKRGNTAIAAKDYTTAFTCYSNGIGMDPCDDDLLLALRNNRAQAALSLGKFTVAIEDASYVLARQRHNAKALLRRATAFSQLYRPVEAIEDLRRLLIAEPRNAEALKLRARVEDELAEHEDLVAFKAEEKQKAAERGKKRAEKDRGSSNTADSAAAANADDEDNVKRMVIVSAQLVDSVQRLAMVLSEEKQQTPKAVGEEGANPEEDAVQGVGCSSPPLSSSSSLNSPITKTNKPSDAADDATIITAPDVEVEKVLKSIIDDLCEVGGILALNAGSALLFRSQHGLHAVVDIVTLLTTNPKTLGRTRRTTESLLMLPMSVVCLTCAYRVLGSSFPSVTSRQALLKVVLKGSPHGDGVDGNVDVAEVRRGLLTAVGVAASEEEGKKKTSSPSAATAKNEDTSNSHHPSSSKIVVEPYSMIAMAVLALCASTPPTALQSALASSATLRSIAPWAMTAVMHTKKSIASPAAACLVSLGAYAPLHAACADFLSAILKEESGTVLSLLFVGGGAMAPPMWSAASLGTILDGAARLVKSQRRGSNGSSPSSSSVVSAIPTLTAMLHVLQRMMTHTAAILDISEEQKKKEFSEEDKDAADAECSAPSPSATTSALAMLESRNLIHSAVIPACLVALGEDDNSSGNVATIGAGSSSQHLQQRLQEAALEVLLVVPSRAYKSGGSGSSGGGEVGVGSSTPAADSILVKDVLRALLPATFGAFVGAVTDWCSSTTSSADADNSSSKYAARLAAHSYKSEAALAIVYNALVQASPSPSNSTSGVSDRARLVGTLKERTRLYTYANALLEAVGGVSTSASPSHPAIACLLMRHLNVVARFLGVVDRTAGASEAMANAMRGDVAASSSSAPPLPPVMPALWTIISTVTAGQEKEAKGAEDLVRRTGTASSTPSSSSGTTTSAAAYNKRRYDLATLEHASVLMATLFFAKAPADFQREFAALPATTTTTTSNSSGAAAALSGEERLRLLLKHLRFEGGYMSGAAAATTTTTTSAATANATANTVEVMQYSSNAIFVGNVALLLGRVPAGSLVGCKALSEKERAAAVVIEGSSSAPLPFTVAGAIYVQSDAVKLGIDAICGIRSAVQDLERDVSKFMPAGATTASCQQQQPSPLIASLTSQIRHLRGAQKNLATMVSKWLTGTVGASELNKVLLSDAPSASSPSADAEAILAAMEQRRAECAARLTNRLRDVKGFEVLAVSLKETS